MSLGYLQNHGKAAVTCLEKLNSVHTRKKLLGKYRNQLFHVNFTKSECFNCSFSEIVSIYLEVICSACKIGYFQSIMSIK